MLNIKLKTGNTLVSVSAIAHRSWKGQGQCFFIGKVTYPGDPKPHDSEIAVEVLGRRHLGGPRAVQALRAAMTTYRAKNGEWDDQGHVWRPHQPAGMEPLSERDLLCEA